MHCWWEKCGKQFADLCISPKMLLCAFKNRDPNISGLLKISHINCLYCITWQLSVTCAQAHHHNAVCDSFTVQFHIYFTVVAICFFPADAIFHEKHQHNRVPSHFTSALCQGASEHDINIHLFLYSGTVQTVSAVKNAHITYTVAFWIIKSSCHASQVDSEVIWALCSRT